MTTDSVSDALAGRYGTPPPWHRRVLVTSVAAVALALAGWLAWTIWEQARPVVSSGDLTYSVVDDNTTQTRFRVEMRGEPSSVTCTLKAYAVDHSLVGQLAFTPEPGAGGVVEQQLNTERRATSVDLVGCTADDQPRPR